MPWKNITTIHYSRIVKKLEKFKQLSWFYNTTWLGGDKYQVISPDDQFVVDKKKYYYSCKRWQLSGIPCSHALLVLYYYNEKTENYIDACDRVKTFMDIYICTS